MRKFIQILAVLAFGFGLFGGEVLGQGSCPGYVIVDRNYSPARISVGRSSMTCDFNANRVMPVVIHVIHNGEPIETSLNGITANVSDQAIFNQIEMTNDHFRKVGVPASLYPNDAVDVNVAFQLARSDPDGNPHSGINRVNWLDYTSTAAPYTIDYIDYNIKPFTRWDPSRYVNIWIIPVTRNDGVSIGGFAKFPDEPSLPGYGDWTGLIGDNSIDGVVINFNTVNDVIDGSTLTHELGHYLGLIHTFGKVGVNHPNGCSFDDYCDDTPLTKGIFFGGPDSCQLEFESCIPGTRAMIENFMDYAVPCGQIFTNDQKYRIITSLFSPRRPTHNVASNEEWYGLDTYEPNNTLASSVSVFPELAGSLIDSTIESYMFHSGEEDWYELVVNGHGTLTIDLTSLPEDYNVELYGPGGLSDWWNGPDISGSSNEQIQRVFPGAVNSILYVRVFSDDYLFDRCDPYSLTVNWNPAQICVPMTFDLAATNASSQGATDGSVTVNVTSGTPPYTYSWSNGNTGSSLTNVGVGSYDLTITGSDGCTATSSAYVGIDGEPQPYCFGTVTLTGSSGSFNDGSGSSDYANNSSCCWLIDPTANVSNIILEFPTFNLDETDSVLVYDGSNHSAPIIGNFTGNSIPPTLTSSGSTMFVTFYSDEAIVDGGWSANYYTQILPDGASLVQYEYWFDDDWTNRVQTGISPTQIYTLNTNIPTTGLTTGLHSFHIRFKDDRGQWSSVLSQLVYKANVVNNGNGNSLVNYEYWFDDNHANAVSQNINQQEIFELVDNIDMSGLTTGLHSFHIRFQDQGDQWSSVLSQLVYKANVVNNGNGNSLVNYEYWFDDDHANAVSQSINQQEVFELISNIDASAQSNGLHGFHIRFEDQAGQWSSVLSQLVYKTGNAVNPLNQIRAYRYWFDMDDLNMVTETVGQPMQQFVLDDMIDASALSLGEHRVHFQFQDIAAQWSSVLTDTINVCPEILTEETIDICSGDNYTFPDGTVMNNLTVGLVHSSTLVAASLCDSVVETTVNVLDCSCDNPTTYSVTDIQPDQVTINWSVIPNANEYNVKVREVGGSWSYFTLLDTFKVVTGLNSEMDYEYKVQTVCDVNSPPGYGDIQYFTTAENLCSNPTGQTISGILSTQVTISWDAVPGAMTYKLRLRKVGTTEWLSNTITAPTTFKIRTNLEPDSEYEYGLKTICASNSPANYGVTGTFTTLDYPCDNPTGILVSDLQPTEVTISWDPVPNATKYKVKVRMVGTTVWSFHTIQLPDTFKVRASLEPGTDYEYKVKTVCAFNSPLSWSAFQYFTTPEDPCSNPSGQTVTDIGATQATISWDGVPDALTYKLRIRKEGTTQWLSNTITAPTTFKVRTNLEPGSEYEYGLKTLCATNSPAGYGLSGTFTTLDYPCDNPIDHTVSDIQPTGATMSWNSEPNAIKYKLKIRETGTTAWSFHTIQLPDTFKVRTGLLPSTNYEYKVKTVCSFNTPLSWGVTQYFATAMARLASEGSEESRISVFPNPTTGKLTVVLTGHDQALIAVRNMHGQLIYRESVAGAGQHGMELEGASGLYSVEVITNTGRSELFKVIKE